MNRKIDLKNSSTKKLHYLSDTQFKEKFEKGWSFSSVYHFNELKDIFLLIKENGFYDLKSFTSLSKKKGVIGVTTDWKDRRMLEQLNALKNFGLISYDYKIIEQDTFVGSSIGNEINKNDLIEFEKIYFSYVRFKEIINWFFKPNSLQVGAVEVENLKSLVNEFSSPVFSFSRFNRFTDSFLYDLMDSSCIYYIENIDKDLMRFWDVFLKWGVTLELIQKINLNIINISIDNFRNAQCTYFINNNEIRIDLKSYIESNFKKRYIYIPDLVFKIAIDYRYSVESIKIFLIAEYEKNKYLYNLDRASEIFINKGGGKDEVLLHPMYKGSFISHLTLLR